MSQYGSTDLFNASVTTATAVDRGLVVERELNFGTDYGGLWRDQLAQLIPPTGAGIPTMTQVSSSPISAPLWQLNDRMWIPFHIQHDYAPGTDIYLHVHWFTDGVTTASVKWQWTYYHAKGHNQANFAMSGGGTVVTAEQAYHGTAYRHMITETAAITVSGLEPDSLLLTELKRVTNGGTNNTDSVFAFMADMHYQANAVGTKNRTPDFYT